MCTKHTEVTTVSPWWTRQKQLKYHFAMHITLKFTYFRTFWCHEIYLSMFLPHYFSKFFETTLNVQKYTSLLNFHIFKVITRSCICFQASIFPETTITFAIWVHVFLLCMNLFIYLIADAFQWWCLTVLTVDILI